MNIQCLNNCTPLLDVYWTEIHTCDQQNKYIGMFVATLLKTVLNRKKNLSISGRMDNQIVEQSHTLEIIPINKNDWTTVTQNYMNEFYKHNAERKKPGTKKNTNIFYL